MTETTIWELCLIIIPLDFISYILVKCRAFYCKKKIVTIMIKVLQRTFNILFAALLIAHWYIATRCLLCKVCTQGLRFYTLLFIVVVAVVVVFVVIIRITIMLATNNTFNVFQLLISKRCNCQQRTLYLWCYRLLNKQHNSSWIDKIQVIVTINSKFTFLFEAESVLVVIFISKFVNLFIIVTTTIDAHNITFLILCGNLVFTTTRLITIISNLIFTL